MGSQAREAGLCEARLDQKLVAPVLQVLEGLLRVDIVHQHTAIRASVEGDAQALESLLAGCVPDLRERTLKFRT